MSENALFTRFQRRLTALGGECLCARNLDEAAQNIAEHPALAQHQLVIPPGFSGLQPWGAILELLFGMGVRMRVVGSVAAIADAPAGLSQAVLAVAETGSVLIAENSLEARSVSMLVLTHFVLVSEQDIVPMLDDVGARLQQLTRVGPEQRHYISLITGPSRTSDIERVLTIGVQGPKALCVIVVGA